MAIAKRMTDRERLIYEKSRSLQYLLRFSNVRAIQDKYDIPYLDYTKDEALSNHDFYFNALFMNLRGRKFFTKRVLKDLNLIKP